MPWYTWTVVALIGVSTALNITNIGKPRKPTTPGIAVGVAVINGLMVWAIVETASW